MEFENVLRLAAGLAVVLAIMGALGWAARRFDLARFAGQQGKRLGVVETIPLDARRRLVLVRRDGVEHLVLLGQHGDLVIERGGAPAGPA